MTIEVALIILAVFCVTTVILLLAILIQKGINSRNIHLQGVARDILFKRYFDQENVKAPLSNRFFFDAFIDIETQVQIEEEVRQRVIADILQTRFVKQQMRNRNHFNPIKRKLAIFYLHALKTDQSKKMLATRLYKEKNYSVFFYLIHALKETITEDQFKHILNRLSRAPESFTKWIYELFKNNYRIIEPYVEAMLNDERVEVKRLFIFLASKIPTLTLKDYAMSQFNDLEQPESIRLLALEAVATMHPYEIHADLFCTNDNEAIRRIALSAAAYDVSQSRVDQLMQSVDGSSLDLDRVNALSRIVYDSKSLLLYLFDYYFTSINQQKRDVIARVLSNYVDYIILKTDQSKAKNVKVILENMMHLHIVEDFIDFMNRNKDIQLEKQLLPMIKSHISQDNVLLDQFLIYLNKDILSKMGLIKKSQPISKREKAPREKRKTRWIIRWIIFAVLFFPLLFFILRFQAIISGEIDVFIALIVHLNYSLMFYFLTINTIYLILLLFSLKGAQDRLDLWRIKKQTLLFEHDLLPSISIIAPAYNEDKSIIESVTSLLNLRYPKYEVIVVNDGSKDNTIQVLIDHFQLERKHPFFEMPLQTKPLRGVYVNRHIPNLIVIDKQNGGKADALNLGINVASGEYVCGIDADSLLEENALLKLMSVTLDDPVDHIALGGNIVPVNGCVVDKGKIEKKGLGKKTLVRFQTLEYLRAFTTGRIGWSQIRSLLIVSGAFGLFKRLALMETGGYLTISGKLKKDTVGEDMELIVRLTYQALSMKRPYRVTYVHDANCYTELPSDFSSLLKQRNRWQRGLLDILSYHRKLLFNPRFKQPGLIGFPYFFIFEMMGPFIEMMGYIALLIGLSFDLLNVPLVIVLLIVTIGYGIVISLFSLLIAERKSIFYSIGETILLIFIAIFENFGYRQIMSLHRIASTFSALKESGTWGSQKRQGFTSKTQ